MLYISIVDDEAFIRKQIGQWIKDSGIDCQLKEYGSGEALLFSQGYADIIFLDIRMKGENGVETARRLRKQHNNSILIFVTALKEYVFEAFDVSAFHYLLKPLEATRFQQVLLRAVQEAISRKANTSPPLFLKMKGRNITLNQQSIIYLENHLKKVEIHTTSESIELYASMKELEEQLDHSFFRCHRGYLVNMFYIKEYDRSRISLKNGETIYMAKEKYPAFVEAYMRYLQYDFI